MKKFKDVDSYIGLKTPKRKQPKPLWQDRTRVLFATLVFCGLCIAYITFQGKDTNINSTIVLGCFGLSGTVIGFFTGAKTWHDVNIEKLKCVSQVQQAEIANQGGVVPVAPGVPVPPPGAQ